MARSTSNARPFTERTQALSTRSGGQEATYQMRLMSRAAASARRPSAPLAATHTGSYSAGLMGRVTGRSTRKQWSSSPPAWWL
jgi:hypothetical protein